jgi:lipopolysaccharide transport system permease protein
MMLGVFADQAIALTAANMKSRYRDTLMGLLWVILNPLIMYGAQSLVFSKVLHVAIPHYALFLLLGLLPWLFINQSVQMTAALLVHSAAFLKAYNVHPLVLVAASVLDNFVNFFLSFLLILVPAAILSDIPSYRFLLLIGPAIFLGIFAMAACWLISILHVFYRDTAFVMNFILNVSFFLTPIFYSANMVDQKYHWLIQLNLIYLAIRPFQSLVYSSDVSFGISTLVAFGLAGGMAGLVALVWRWRKNELYSCL